MVDRPRVEYASIDAEAFVAWQRVGEGERTILFLPGPWTNLEVDWDYQPNHTFLRRLAALGSVLRFDRRSTGLSDPLPGDRGPTLEDWVQDAIAVLDAAEADGAVIYAHDLGVACAVLLAATRPERVRALVLHDGFARWRRAADYPAGMPDESTDRWVESDPRVLGCGGQLGSRRPVGERQHAVAAGDRSLSAPCRRSWDPSKGCTDVRGRRRPGSAAGSACADTRAHTGGQLVGAPGTRGIPGGIHRRRRPSEAARHRPPLLPRVRTGARRGRGVLGGSTAAARRPAFTRHCDDHRRGGFDGNGGGERGRAMAGGSTSMTTSPSQSSTGTADAW